MIMIAARHVTQRTGTGRTVIEHVRRLKNLGIQVVVVGEDLDRNAIRLAGGRSRQTLRLPFGKVTRRRFFSKQVDMWAAWSRPALVWGHGDNFRQHVLSLHNCVHLAHEVMSGQQTPLRSSVAQIHTTQLRRHEFRTMIANSHLMKEDVEQRFGVPNGLIKVVYPGFDPSQFNLEQCDLNRTTLRREWGIGDETFLIALVTSGDFVKRNVSGCLAAFAEARRQSHRPTKLLVIGKQTASNTLTSHIAEADLTEHVRVLPPRTDIEKVYHASDLCVHPALIEEFGQVVQEAIMCGTPVLTSRRVGSTELFPRSNDILVLDTPEHTALVQGMLAFLDHPEYATAWWQPVHAAMKHNTWDYNFDNTFRIISGLAEM